MRALAEAYPDEQIVLRVITSTVEFALETVRNPICVATYQLQAQLPPALQAQLPTPQQLEVELDFAIKSIESSSLPPSDPQEI